MNKGFAYYFKQAFGCSVRTVWKNKNIIQSMIYFFMSLAARLTLLLGAVISLADVRQAKIAKLQQRIDIPQSFTKASHRSLWTAIVAYLLEGLIYIGGFIFVSLGCAALMAIGIVIAQSVAAEQAALILIIFAVPCLIIYAIYSIIFASIFSPTAYVIDNNPDLSAGDVLSVCVNTMRGRGKMTVILCVGVPLLIELAIVGIFVMSFALLFVLGGSQSFVAPVAVLLGVVALAVFGLTFPMFEMTKNISTVTLFGDIALDPVNAHRRTAGINIKKITGAKIDREEIADNLNALFDESLGERTPDPALLVHTRKKRVKAEKPVGATNEVAQAETNATAPQPEAQLQDIDEYPEDTYAAKRAAEEAKAAESVQAQAEQPIVQQPVYEQPVQQPQPIQQQPVFEQAVQQQPVYQQPVQQQPVQQPIQQQVYQQPVQQQPVFEQPVQQQPIYQQPVQQQPVQQPVYQQAFVQQQQPVYQQTVQQQPVQQPVYQQTFVQQQPVQQQPIYQQPVQQPIQQQVYQQPMQQQPVYQQPIQQQPPVQQQVYQQPVQQQSVQQPAPQQAPNPGQGNNQ